MCVVIGRWLMRSMHLVMVDMQSGVMKVDLILRYNHLHDLLMRVSVQYTTVVSADLTCIL